MLNIYEKLRMRIVKSEFVKQCSINVGIFEVSFFVLLTSVQLYYPVTVLVSLIVLVSVTKLVSLDVLLNCSDFRITWLKKIDMMKELERALKLSIGYPSYVSIVFCCRLDCCIGDKNHNLFLGL
jgi:hypothetical protein